MRIQIVQDHTDYSSVGLGLIHQPEHLNGEVFMVRRSVIATCRKSPRVSQIRNRLRVPARTYS